MVEHPSESHLVQDLFSRSNSATVPLQTGHVSDPAAIGPGPVESELKIQSAVEPETPGTTHLKQVVLTPMEELLGSMWSQVLKKERVQPDDNFFSCGGDSLLATQLMLYVRARLKVDLPIRLLIEGNPHVKNVRLQSRAGIARRSESFPASA